MGWADDKNLGPWDFTPQEDKYGYLPNPRWSGQADAQAFCEDQGLELDLPNQHLPCGHWHKAEVTEEPFPAGKWVAAMQQPGTPYIYVYDIVQKAVIRIDTSEIPVFVSSVLKLDSAYALDYDMGWGNPGAQRGAYCMNKDATRVWYFFNEADGDRTNAELVEVDISKTNMLKVESTHFTNLMLPGATSSQRERVNDGCSDDTHTYWCTDLVGGRIIKIQNSDHSIVDDHAFDYPIEACGSGIFDEPIATIDFDKNTGKLFWVYCRDHSGCSPSYNVCRHFIRSDTSFTQEIDDIICSSGAICGCPAYQNMLRIYANHILHHKAHHPSFDAHLMKRGLNCVEDDEIAGTDSKRYACIKSHVAAATSRPITGGDWPTYWVRSAHSGGDAWVNGTSYSGTRIMLQYLQNIFGVKNDKVFALMHVNSLNHPAYLYCIDFSDMAEVSKLDVSYYAGQRYPTPYDWAWTSVSAMNQQTGVIAIFRYNAAESRNYVGCFDAKPTLDFLCDVPLHVIRHVSSPEALDEPQIWPFEGFTPPEIPEEDPPVEVISDPGPGEIIYVPPPTPPDDVPDDGVTLLQSGFTGYIDVGPGETIFFKFVAGVADGLHPIQVQNTPQSQEPRTVFMLIKRGSKPTIADFERTWLLSPDLSGLDGLYWKYSTGTEFVEIAEPMESGTFYIMLYNKGTRSVRDQRLTLYYYD